MPKVVIIAEAGVNHNGSLEIAKKLIDAAWEAGADYVKFQTFKAEKLVSMMAQKASYQTKNTGPDEDNTQFAMLKKLELSENDHEELIKYCNQRNIKFLSTGFDLESVELLDSFKPDYFKVPSGEITNLPLLKKIDSLKQNVILSTGMATMQEIKEAMDVLTKTHSPYKKITVLHCNTEYPTPYEDVNLNALLSMKRELGVEVGYSDHTAGIEVAIAAVALGATMIEKHFTLDRNMEGPDHKASLIPEELKQMVASIRNIEKALGSKEKIVTESEKKNIIVARKSIHYARNLSKGHIIHEEDFEMKRPGNGISPMRMDEYLGKKLNRDVQKDHLLTKEDFE